MNSMIASAVVISHSVTLTVVDIVVNSVDSIVVGLTIVVITVLSIVSVTTTVVGIIVDA